MTNPTKAQRHVAAKIAARYTKNCTAQVGVLMPCESSGAGPCNDCRRRYGLTREIAAALVVQREQSAQIVEALFNKRALQPAGFDLPCMEDYVAAIRDGAKP